jgi:hypothetical protein
MPLNALALGCVSLAVLLYGPHAAVAGPKPPSKSKYNSIALERGVTQDSGLAQWANGPQHPPKPVKGSTVRGPAAVTGSRP